jgi:hypothetical protein
MNPYASVLVGPHSYHSKPRHGADTHATFDPPWNVKIDDPIDVGNVIIVKAMHAGSTHAMIGSVELRVSDLTHGHSVYGYFRLTRDGKDAGEVFLFLQLSRKLAASSVPAPASGAPAASTRASVYMPPDPPLIRRGSAHRVGAPHPAAVADYLLCDASPRTVSWC